MSPKRGLKLKMQKHSVKSIGVAWCSTLTFHSEQDDDRGRVRPFTVPEFQAFAKETGLNTIAVQQMTRYRRLRWPFYHQFTVITTVKILPSALEARMFSLPTLEGRNVLLEDLDPAVNGISFRIDRGRRSEWGEGIFEPSTHQKCDDTLEIIRPGAKPWGDQALANSKSHGALLANQA
ncbi:hypothetical protein BS47DRAFT_1395988 [Hydnum rufescens UP504]|uniref:Uncharacterized protein n=1 Tax=Hydnum rufescens UP504 TaxID=1448309 RepID=A0A9P6ARA0_9AGAM|nr:hypothetical protein BS47DRAFT_1395988 [Hydnum rufescens UP504]